jgi:CBF1 interacting corepressor
LNEMPGISFLFKKRFHPSRIDNQKQVFIAEQKRQHRNEQEAVAAVEVLKEKEIQSYELLGQAPERDPRAAGLKFMYSMPQPADKKKLEEINKSGRHYEPVVHKDGEDEMVKEFKAKLLQHVATSSSKTTDQISGEVMEEVRVFEKASDNESKQQAGASSSSSSLGGNGSMSALEKSVGRRARNVVPTLEEQAARHAFLKNAPVEGVYAKNIAVRHKPFNEVVRNVQCLRCGQWGHQSGDRECQLRDYNPQDYKRQQREDPLFAMNHSRLQQGAVGNNTASSGRNGIHDGSEVVYDDDDSDPEAVFLATLTRREKKLLLRKLMVR